MRHHPFAEIFPMMDDAEFDALCADIKANGLKDEIVTFYDQILDGRNREKACRKMGVTPRFKVLATSANALAYVLSKNLHRRHLNESQRAMVAANLAKLNGTTDTAVLPIGKKTERVETAAKSLNVAPRSVARAVRVIESGDEQLIADVTSGKTSVSKAAEAVAPTRHAPKRSKRSAYKVICGLLDALTNDELQQLGIEVADRLS